MKDHKGYECRPFDEHDQVVMCGCAVAICTMLLLYVFGVIV